jgi:ATP-dependent DNA helicase RecG
MSHTLHLKDNITKIPGIGPTTFFKFQKKNITTVFDLLKLYPLSYTDYSIIKKVSHLNISDVATICGKITKFETQFTRNRKLTIQKAVLCDNSGCIDLIWFNQPFLKQSISENSEYYFSGITDSYGSKLIFKPSNYEVKSTIQLNTARIVPNYTQSMKISSRFIRKIMSCVLNSIDKTELKEYLITNNLNLPSPFKTFSNLHLPTNLEDLEQAKKRLLFEKLLAISHQNRKLTLENRLHNGYKIKSDNKSATNFNTNLPFKLTSSQNTAISEILADLSTGIPMSRMLLGDVGSGKTVVITRAIYEVYNNNYKSIVLVPTEILAKQHFSTICNFLQKTKAKITLLTSKTNKINLDFDILVTTHKAFYLNKQFNNVALVVIDEQHKFGVDQRQKLVKLCTNHGRSPHLLSVSATPIPRSLALVIFGGTQISMLEEMPIGRKPVKTYFIPQQKREDAYKWINTKILGFKTQAFVVCPLIEESQSNKDNELKSVVNEFNALSRVFNKLKIDLLHSKVKDKDKVISNFEKNKTNILITTTVVEVGIDMKNASIMIIEDADRFGLSQLHQLRGRIGRGVDQSYCFLFSKSTNSDTIKRLKILQKINSGFKLAEYDLRLRGAGRLHGTEQHGHSLIDTNLLLNKTFMSSLSQYTNILVEKDDKFIYNSLFKEIGEDINYLFQI